VRGLPLDGSTFDRAAALAAAFAVIGMMCAVAANAPRPPIAACSAPTETAVPKDDLSRQGRIVGTAPGAAVGKSTVDDYGWRAADAVTTGRHRDGTNFDIVLGARQKLDQVHSLGACRATGCKDLDFSALRDVVLP
jgi:hypothetical protein